MSRPERLTKEQMDSLQSYLKGAIDPPNDLAKHMIKRINEVTREINELARIHDGISSELKRGNDELMRVRERLTEKTGLGGGYMVDLWEIVAPGKAEPEVVARPSKAS